MKTIDEIRAARNAAAARYRAKNPEKTRERQLSWRARNPEYFKEWARKNSARRSRTQRESRHKSVQRYPAPENCEICSAKMENTVRGAQFDHDHSTGFHRGWLCNSCNN